MQPRSRWETFCIVLAVSFCLEHFGVAALLLAALFCWLHPILIRGTGFAQALDSGLPPDEVETLGWRRWLFPALGFAFVIVMLAVQEVRHPFFFTQDDNIVQFLPVMIQGGQSILHGVFPDWNPYQFMGAPTANLGVYALTYPVTYFCYLFARFCLGNENWMIEVFSFFHLIAAFFATYWAARCCRVRPALASLAGACIALSGFALIGTRSWYYVSPAFAFSPLGAVSLAKLRSNGPSWTWILLTGLWIGAFFHAGNAQFWAYAMLFFFLSVGISLLAQSIPFRSALAAGTSAIIGGALAGPLLIPQLVATRDVARIAWAQSGQITEGWLSFLIPGHWIGVQSVSDWMDPQWSYDSAMVYSGTIFVAACALVLLSWLLYRIGRKELADNVWIVCAAIALLSMIGGSQLWRAMLELPMLSKFRLPFKFLIFFNVFASIGGAVAVERYFRAHKLSARWDWGLYALTCGLLAGHCLSDLPSFYKYSFRPYPNLAELQHAVPMISPDMPYRIISLTTLRSPAPEYWRSLPMNLPTVFRVAAVAGYDPLIDQSPEYQMIDYRIDRDPLTSLPEYGVRYALESDLLQHPVFTPSKPGNKTEASQNVSNRVKAAIMASAVTREADGLRIHQFPNAKPLAYREDSPATPLHFQLNAGGAAIDTTAGSGQGRVILNMLWYPDFRCTAQDSSRLNCSADKWDRIAIEVPPNVTQVRVSYRPPWLSGIMRGAMLFCAGLALSYVTLHGTKPQRR